MSTANTPLYIAQLFDLKSSSDPPFFIELFVYSWRVDHSFRFGTISGLAACTEKKREQFDIDLLVQLHVHLPCAMKPGTPVLTTSLSLCLV